MRSCYKKKKRKQLDEIRHTTPHCRPKNLGKKTKQLRERNSLNLADFQFPRNNTSLSLATLQHKSTQKRSIRNNGRKNARNTQKAKVKDQLENSGLFTKIPKTNQASCKFHRLFFVLLRCVIHLCFIYYLEMLIRNYINWQSSKAIPEE